MIRKVIGIISWLPDNKTREIRQKQLEELLIKCNYLFNLPIILIAQNWHSDVRINSNCAIFHFEKLGIVEARKKLREKFLDSSYDYLIMLDDDSQLVGTKEDAQKYLQQIDENPNSVGVFKKLLLKLFAISKTIMQCVEYENINVENGEGFEDMIFIEKCKKKFPSNFFIFDKFGLDDISNSGNDKYSTWYTGQYVKKDIGDKSRKIISEC